MAMKTTKLKANLLNPKCTPPDVGDLTPLQQEAMHVFVHEVLASLHRLYMIVPPNQTDPIIDKYLP